MTAIVQELAKGDTLQAAIEKRTIDGVKNFWSEAEVLKMFAQILLGVKHRHDNDHTCTPTLRSNDIKMAGPDGTLLKLD